MMVTLKKLASTGCTLIFTIYQSSTEVFGLFDRICLLSNGNTLFFGETLACLQVKETGNLILHFVPGLYKDLNFRHSKAHRIWATVYFKLISYSIHCCVLNLFAIK